MTMRMKSEDVFDSRTCFLSCVCVKCKIIMLYTIIHLLNCSFTIDVVQFNSI